LGTNWASPGLHWGVQISQVLEAGVAPLLEFDLLHMRARSQLL